MDKISNERKAQIFYQGDGTQTQYSFPFDYLRKAFVHVSLISDEKIEELTQGTDYTVTDRVVTLAAPTGLKIKIYRVTTTKPLVGWADASVLRAADMTVQSTQLLHLAEEVLDMAQDKGLTTDDNDGVWDARYNKIKNLLEPTEAGDAVNLGYITKNQDSLLNKLNSTGATQNKSIVATGDAQNARLIATGEAQNTRLLATGDNKNKTLEDTGDAQNARLIATGNEQNTRLTVTGTYQNKLVTDTGKSYVSTMTTLKDAVVNKANEVNSSADLAKKWAMSDTSPDGNEDSKSAKTWAANAKTSETHAFTSEKNAGMYADRANTYMAQADNRAAFAATKATEAENSATAAAKSATNAANSATEAANSLTQLGTHEANAAASAAEAKKHAENAQLFDPTTYFKAKDVLRGATQDNGKPGVVNIPLEAGMFPIYGFPDGTFKEQPSYEYGIVVNFQGTSGSLLSLYSLNYFFDETEGLYYRIGFKDKGWNGTWHRFANTENVAKQVTNAITNLKTDNNALFDYLHRVGYNATLPTTNAEINKLGIFSVYYDVANTINNQPSQYGQLINIPGSQYAPMQMWLSQPQGKIYMRGGNGSISIDSVAFRRVLDADDMKTLRDAIPKKLSQLTNDANYVTTTDVATAVEKSATTIKAQIPKATSQLTNDSGYATTESVDNKIDAVWDTPLDWDTLESSTILDGTSILYDVNNIPTRFRLQLLYDIFKRDTDTQLDNYVLKTDYSQEAKKWKDAYNNLRKRSTPTAFDDDELTVLMNTPIERGTITLSQPYTDFDGLLIDFSDDDGALLNSTYISTAELNRRIARAKDIGISSIFLLSEYYYWTIWITERNGFSTTTFPNRGENCQIKCIYGVKLKEIT